MGADHDGHLEVAAVTGASNFKATRVTGMGKLLVGVGHRRGRCAYGP